MKKLLNEIAEVSAGQGAPQGDENYSIDSTPFVKAGNLYDLINGESIDLIQKVNDDIASKYRLKKFPAGTVVFAKSGMSCLKGYVYVLPTEAYVVNHLACIVPYFGLSEYLKFYFMHHKPSELIKDSSYPSIRLSDISDIVINLPELSECMNIVKILKNTERIIKIKKLQLLEFGQLIKSRFVEMFDGKGLPVLKWNDVFNTTTGKLDSNAMVDAGQYPFFTCAKEIYAIDTYAFDKEALLLAGNNASGKYDVKYYKGKFNAYQRTYVLDLKQNWSYQLFKYQLEDKLEWLREQSKGSNTRYITLKILGDLDFIIPPLTKQVEFEKFCNHVDKLKFEDCFLHKKTKIY